MKKIFLSLLLLAALVVTGCASQSDDSSLFTVREDSGITIDMAQLTQSVSFLDIGLGDDAVHLLARVDENGVPHLSWNTCQVCSGSPYAYFALEDDVLVCQNCGNRFSINSIGGKSFGCYPWAVADYAIEDGKIILSTETLTTGAPSFKNWKKGL